MKYIKGINESLNSKELNKEEFLNIIRNNCKNFIKYCEFNIFDKYSLIYRKCEDLGDYVLVDPKSSTKERIAPYANNNYHNLLISNLESWKKWPKRNKSLICASYARALRHGKEKLYVVIPFDKTKIAVCSESDFWYSFKNLPLYRSMIENNESNSAISFWMDSLIECIDSDIDKKLLNKDWSLLKKFLEVSNISEKDKKRLFTNKQGRYMYKNYFNLLENLNNFLNPQLNKFLIGDSIDIMNIYSKLNIKNDDYISESKESWMEDEVLLVKVNIFFDEIEKNFIVN